jgi:hypothetical protein
MKFRNQIILLILLIICFVICQDAQNNETNRDNDIEIIDSKENEDIKTKPEDKSKKLGYSIEVNDENIKSIEIESIDFEEPVELTDPEMDMILFCAYLSQQALKTKFKEDVNQIADKMGEPNPKKVYDKLGSEFMENCVNYVEQETVNIYITNLTYHNHFKWEKEFDNYTKIDFNKYNSTEDLKYTVEQQVLLKFLRQSNEEFEKRRRQRKNIREPEKPKEVKVNKNVDKHFNNKESIIKENIWKEIKFFTGFVLLLITFVGIIYFLKNISSGKKEKIKKEKNKKEKIN